MAKEIKRLCWNCAELLRHSGQGCRRLEDAGGSTGVCLGCGKRRVCESYEITYGRETAERGM